MRTDESIPADAVASSAEVIKTLWWSGLRHSRSAQRGNLLNLEKKIARRSDLTLRLDLPLLQHAGQHY
jgi:hypothetical protein